LKHGKVEAIINFATGDATLPRSPGIVGKLRFVISLWNQSNREGWGRDAASPLIPEPPVEVTRGKARSRATSFTI
jgi:hypothetical protein